MGYFTKPGDETFGGNLPLSAERIQAYLDEREWRYFVDDDGDIGGQWDGHPFYFFRIGEKKEILQIRGRWNRTMPFNTQPELLEFLNEYQTERIWPKAFLRGEDAGIGVYAEVSTDLEFGVADDQLSQLISCGLFTSLRLFAALDERFGAASDQNDDSDPATSFGSGPDWL